MQIDGFNPGGDIDTNLEKILKHKPQDEVSV